MRSVGRLQSAGYDDAVVQTFGSPVDILIRLGQSHDPKLGDQVLSALQADQKTRI